MGGDRVCPDDCPLAVWAQLDPNARKAQRRIIAEKLYHQGFTQTAIATQLGVSQSTIRNDLEGLVESTKPPRPKGGRPKSTAPKPKTPRQEQNVKRDERIVAMADEGMSNKAIAAEVGLVPRGVAQVVEHERIRREAVADIDPATLSMSAKEKLDAAIRQHKRDLDRTFEQRVMEEVTRRINDMSLPSYLKQIKEIRAMIEGRKGVMDRASYRKILACLHPDRMPDPQLKKRYEEAFNLFAHLEKRLLDEKQSPTEFRQDLPRTWEEWTAARQRVREQNRARSKTARDLQRRS
jgi:transposase